MQKRELTKSQVYAAQATNAKLLFAQKEFQYVLNAIAEELKVDAKNEKWAFSKDMRFLEQQMVVLENKQKKEK